MPTGQSVITDAVVAEAEVLLRKLGTVGTVAKKLNAVIAAKKHGMEKVCEVLGVSRTSIYLWAKKIESGDGEGLINKSKHQDGIKIKQHHQEAMAAWLTESPNMGLLLADDWKQNGVDILVTEK